MNSADVVIIDYGLGNLLSVQRALEYCGAKVEITADAVKISNASRVILPGVGAFAVGMNALHQRNLINVVRNVALNNTPLLGICLGMQMLLEQSEEFGITPGLGLIPGRVVAVPVAGEDGRSQKIPHIGWSGLVPSSGRRNWNHKCLNNVTPGDAAYFVHSFMAIPANSDNCIADTFYGGVKVAAIIGGGNILGCQFHPEKSGEVGLSILRQFIAIN
jgi:glutamine amidotransferase